MRVASSVSALLIFCASLFCSSVQAADLSGVVRDPQGLVIAGAEVRAQRTNGTIHTAATDPQGQYRLTGLPEGAYRVEASASGFDRQSAGIQLDAAGAALNMELPVAGLHEGVVVTASRQQTDTAQLTLPTALVTDQRLSQQMPTNLAQGLAEVPGVYWVGAGPFRSRPVIRGLDSNRLLVLVDGERLNNGRTATNQGGIETSLVEISDIQQVEVVRGPSSVLYGSGAFGGVVNIRTRSGMPSDRLRLGVRAGASAFPNSDGQRAYGEINASNRWFSARARGAGSGINNYRTPSQTVHGSQVDESSALGELRVYPVSGQSASFKYLHKGAYNIGLPSLEENPVFLADFPFNKLTKFSAGYNATFNSTIVSSFQASVYGQAQNRDFFNRIQAGPGMQILSETVTDVDSTGFDAQATSIGGDRHVFTYGVTYFRDRNRDYRLQTMTGAGPRPIVLDDAPSVPNSSFAGTGFFLQEQFAASDRVRFTGGVRVDRFTLTTSPTPNFDPDIAQAIAQDRSDSAVSGNFGVNVNLAEGWTLSGNLGRAFRAPNLFERFFYGRGSAAGFIVPNPGLNPETSLQLDTGIHYRSRAVKVSFNYFLNSLNNLISTQLGSFNGQDTIAGQQVYQNVNIEEARIQGVETTAEFSLNGLGSQWTPSLSAAWQRGTNQTSGQPLSLIAPFIGQAGVRWMPMRSRLWSEVRTMMVPSSSRVPTGFTPIRAFTTFAWRGGYELARGESGLGNGLPRGIASINFHMGVENFGNRTYYGLFESVPQPGRDFRVGIDLTFDTSAQ